MNDRDRIRLRHMLEATAEAAAFLINCVPQDLARTAYCCWHLSRRSKFIREAAAQRSKILAPITPKSQGQSVSFGVRWFRTSRNCRVAWKPYSATTSKSSSMVLSKESAINSKQRRGHSALSGALKSSVIGYAYKWPKRPRSLYVKPAAERLSCRSCLHVSCCSGTYFFFNRSGSSGSNWNPCGAG
jgi:hypothetical protein